MVSKGYGVEDQDVHEVEELEAEHELQMENCNWSSGFADGAEEIEHKARELETLETLAFEHIPSLALLLWLYNGPYEDENGSPTSNGHDDGYFEDPLL